jgi:GTP-binding protein HflX
MPNTLHEIVENKTERAILVSLLTGDASSRRHMLNASLEELRRLAETAGVQTVGNMVQNKDKADPKWFIGKGKVQELREQAEVLEADTVIFDQELSGPQVRNLEEALELKIIDRTQLILDIFAQRASTREGKLQVELAQLNYLLPRLSGHGKNLSRLGGGIGTRGPGETKLETDRRHIRRRIGELKTHLEEVVRHRKLHRERRKKVGIYQAALVGYTNAGKSTLLKQLTDADVYIENQLFATLDPTSKKMTLPNGKEVLVTDTVGFIQNLPHELVAAFRATLEEVCEADLILHVADSSSPMLAEQMEVVEDVLSELGAVDKERIVVFNKADLCPPEQLELLKAKKDAIHISAFRHEDLERLKSMLLEKLTDRSLTYRIPAGRGDIISRAYKIGTVLSQEMDEDFAMLKVEVHQPDFEKYGYILEPYKIT